MQLGFTSLTYTLFVTSRLARLILSRSRTVSRCGPPFARPTSPWGYAGDAVRNFAIPGYKSCVQTTRLEFYSLTSDLPSLYHGVAPVQFLHVMVLPAIPASPTQTWTDYAINAAFSNFGLRYDIVGGTPKFANGWKGWSYNLTRWVRGINKNTLVNC